MAYLVVADHEYYGPRTETSPVYEAGRCDALALRRRTDAEEALAEAEEGWREWPELANNEASRSYRVMRVRGERWRGWDIRVCESLEDLRQRAR